MVNNIQEGTNSILTTKYLHSKQIIIVAILLGFLLTLYGNILIPFILPVISSVLFYAIFRNEPVARRAVLIALWIRIFFFIV